MSGGGKKCQMSAVIILFLFLLPLNSRADGGFPKKVKEGEIRWIYVDGKVKPYKMTRGMWVEIDRYNIVSELSCVSIAREFSEKYVRNFEISAGAGWMFIVPFLGGLFVGGITALTDPKTGLAIMLGGLAVSLPFGVMGGVYSRRADRYLADAVNAYNAYFTEECMKESKKGKKPEFEGGGKK